MSFQSQRQPLQGLSTYEVKERPARGLGCVQPPATGRSYVRIIRENVLNSVNTILFSIALALVLLASSGALTGDAVRSFFKRQMDIAPGKSWFPFDQFDYVIRGIVLTACYIQLTILQYLLLFVIWFFIHPLATLVGYWLKLKNSPI
jgi:hypothetical protein